MKHTKYTCSIYKHSNKGSSQYKAYLCKYFTDNFTFREIVFNFRNFSFREAMLSDNKRLEIRSDNIAYFPINSLDDMDVLVGDYEIEQEGDIFFLVKVDAFQYGRSTKSTYSVSIP